MTKGTPKSEDSLKYDHDHGIVEHEMGIVKFMRWMMRPLKYGLRESSISPMEFEKNRVFEETPEREMQDLAREKRSPIASDIRVETEGSDHL